MAVATGWMGGGGGGRCPWNGVAAVSSGGGCGSKCACDKVAAAAGVLEAGWRRRCRVSAFVAARAHATGWGRCGGVEVVVAQGGGGCGDVEIASVSKTRWWWRTSGVACTSACTGGEVEMAAML